MALAVALCGAAAGAALGQEACPQAASTYELIQRGIFERHGCTTSYCHGEAKTASMDLRREVSYENIVNRPSISSPDGYLRVTPGRPEVSYLWLTMAKRTLQMSTIAGEAMPLGRPRISREELEGLRRWILDGAPAVGIVPEVAELIDLCPRTIQEYGYVPPCQTDDPTLLLPDLVTDAPRDVRLAYRQGHRVLEFTTTVINVGEGPLIVQASTVPAAGTESVNAVQILMRGDGTKCAIPAGMLNHFADVGYWALADLVAFELRRGDPQGPVVARSAKRAFCLIDSEPLRAADDVPHQFEAHCEDGIARMGISVGYADVYHRSRPGQWIDLDAGAEEPVPSGDYYLVNVTDPDDRLWEVDDSRPNNTGHTRVSVRIGPPGGGRPRFTPTPTPRPGDRPPSRPGRVEGPARRERPTRVPRLARPTRAPRPARAERPPRTPRQAAPAGVETPARSRPAPPARPERPSRPEPPARP